MNFRVCSLASGSSGNSYLVCSDNTAVLVDAGISGKRILEGIEYAEVKANQISALFLTHEHEDHVKSVRVLSKKIPGLTVFCSDGTWAAIKDECPNVNRKPVRAGRYFMVGDIEVRPFTLSHDAKEPIGYTFENDERVMTIHTDSGYVTEEAHELLRQSNLLILESNHDVNTLEFCSYPYNTKRRILSNVGHLSNEACGRELLRILEEKEYEDLGWEEPTVLLAHLSKETNFPEMAIATIREILEANGYFERRDYFMHVLDRDHPSKVFII